LVFLRQKILQTPLPCSAARIALCVFYSASKTALISARRIDRKQSRNGEPIRYRYSKGKHFGSDRTGIHHRRTTIWTPLRSSAERLGVKPWRMPTRLWYRSVADLRAYPRGRRTKYVGQAQLGGIKPLAPAVAESRSPRALMASCPAGCPAASSLGPTRGACPSSIRRCRENFA
jgi:hypothetical protein